MKRFFDLILSILLIIFLLVPMAIISLTVFFTSNGPIIYWSKRIGKRNITFTMPKFRTMKTETPDIATHLMKEPKQFLSPIGGFLRRYSLDELPQLFSIFKGDMSFIGPRPIVEKEVSKYGENFSLYKECKPGLSGLWQVSGRNNTTYPERVQHDMYYIRNKSLMLDLKIFFKTIPVILFKKGAY